MEDIRKLDLKITALKDGFRTRLAKISDDYEDQIADLRIALTELDEKSKSDDARIAAQEAELTDLRTKLNELESDEAEEGFADDAN